MTARLILLIVMTTALAACSSSGGRMPADNKVPTGANGGVNKVGNPYKISGKWYYPKEDPAYDEVGVASWYGKQFHGKKTANGEVYNMNALTAAHKTLPMPTNVKVTNLQNGRTIVVRVNDRGPFVGDRVIDLSRRAAQVLGFTNQGTTKVRIQAIDKNGKLVKSNRRYAETARRTASRPVTRKAAEYSSADGMVVQAGSFRMKDNASSRIRELKNAGIAATIAEVMVDGVRYFRVIIGNFTNRGGAETALETVQARGFYDARIITN